MPSIKPLISVLIPVYNQFALLERCLNGLRNQYFADFEVIVVDDGSHHKPDPQLVQWQQSWSRLKWYQHDKNEGRAKARNTALGKAHAELIIFLDADMFIPKDFIQQHWHFHCSRGIGWIGQGKIIETEYLDSCPNASLWTDASQAFFATGNVSVGRKFVEQVGGFDEHFSEYGWEDLELGLRLKKAGLSAASTEARSYHYRKVQSDWSQDIAKEKERGKGAAYFLSKHPILEVRLMAQLTPLHHFMNWLFRGGGSISEATWLEWIQKLRKTHPSLAEALYRALLNPYCVDSTQKEWARLKNLNRN